jgi:hypothetical protein
MVALLWAIGDCAPWHAALDGYAAAVAAYGTARLVELDQWRTTELPHLLASRTPSHVTLEELVWVTEWKMLRGVWRARNLQLVRANPADEVERLSREAARPRRRRCWRPPRPASTPSSMKW